MNPSKFQKSEMGATSKNVHHAYIQPGALARGRGQSFGSLGSVKTSVGKRTLIGEIKNLNSTVFEQNKLAHTHNVMPPCFASMEDDAPLAQDAETMQGAVLKNVQNAYIQPAALARGRGKSLRSLGSAKVNVGKKNLLGEIKNFNSGASKQNKLTHNSNNIMPPGLDTTEDDAPFIQQAEMIPKVGAASKNVQDTYIQPTALARGYGQNFRSSGSAKGSAGKRSLVGKSKNHISTASEQNKLEHNRKLSMPPSFDPMEDDVSLAQEDEMMQKVGATLKNVRDTYIQPTALARGYGQNFRCLGSAKGSAGKSNLVGESESHNSTTSEQNKLAHNRNNSMPPSFDPIEDDVSLAQEDEMLPDLCESEKPKKMRGKNRNKEVAGLKPGEKFIVNFYHNRVIGKHHASFMRHLGILVRDRNMCPLQVHSWKEIREDKLEHMWRAVTEKFDSDDMNHQRDHVLNHMRRLWTNWRGSLHRYVEFKPLHEALKDVPKEVDKSDWEWLVKEHFLTEKFKETSIRNSINRSKLKLPHHTGSKPIREIIYELGGKDGNPPNMATIFFETHKKDNTLVEPEASKKYEKIKELVQSEPSLTNIEVVERCFGPQNKSHMVGLGGGITTKELKGGSSSKVAILTELNATRKAKESLQTELNETKKAKESLEIRMDGLESKYAHLISLLVDQPSSTPSSSQQSTS